MTLDSAIRVARLVAAPPERVWRAFATLAAVPGPLPGGLHAPHGLPRRPGESFPLQVRRTAAVFKGRGTLTAWRPGELAAWRGRVWGLPFSQALILSPQGPHCLAESLHTTSGWALVPARLMLPPGNGARLASEWLRRLAGYAEAAGPAIPAPAQDRA